MSYMVEFERITNVTDYGDYDEACSDDEEERQAEVYLVPGSEVPIHTLISIMILPFFAFDERQIPSMPSHHC